MTKIPSNIFREYDIRGNADKELTDETVRLIGRAYATWLIRAGVNSGVTVGGDARLSTPRIKSAIIEGILSAGLDVVDVGLVTTPMLYWSLIRFNFDGGVMITGSHNPPDMNGLKLCFERGTLWGSEVMNIHTIAESGNFESGHGKLTHSDINDEYLKMLVSKFTLPFTKKFKVVCDSGNGAAGITARKFFEMLGCDCVSLYDEPDGHFPNHHPDPQKRENLKALIERVKSEGADVGFAYDGDADRIGVVDDKGNVIFGDRLMTLYWKEILGTHKGAAVLVEPKCSMVLPELAEKFGGRPIFWKSGHSLIKAKMRELGALFAGEYSGHMFFADEFFGHDDAFYASGRLLRIMSERRESLSRLMMSIPVYPSTEEIRIPCPDDEKFQITERIARKVREKYECSDIDGVRINYPDGWGLIRASNTQPVMVVRCEGKTQEALERIMSDVKARVLAEGLPDFTWTF
ncbi:MAG: phosphomannomutase/phosphoglucomutase [Synergistaceae bacterium]|nr:phosphomannomutase/phosphoglucomutase [Synergistaceae bacterium]